MSQVWEEGKYPAKPLSGRYIESKQKGTPGVEVTFDVMQHKKTVTMYLSDKSEERTMRLLADLGFNGDFENMAFADKEVELSCKHEDYNGKTYEKWNYWGEQQAAPIDISKAKSLTARFKSVAGPAVPKPTTPPVMPKAPAPPSAPPAPPVAKGPPPRVPVKAPESPAQMLATDEASAWAWWNKPENKGKMSDDEINAKWLEIIENINPKDAAGWHKVCEVFSIPF